MINQLRANKKLMSKIQDYVENGRQSFLDLEDGEVADITELCCKALSQQHLAEIIIENIDETQIHQCVAEFLRAGDTLNEECALIQLKIEAIKFTESHFENAVDELIKERYAATFRKNIRFNHAWDIATGRKPLHLIAGASTL